MQHYLVCSGVFLLMGYLVMRDWGTHMHNNQRSWSLDGVSEISVILSGSLSWIQYGYYCTVNPIFVQIHGAQLHTEGNVREGTFSQCKVGQSVLKHWFSTILCIIINVFTLILCTGVRWPDSLSTHGKSTGNMREWIEPHVYPFYCTLRLACISTIIITNNRSL